MEIRNRLFSYPVLCGDTDDYIETTEFIIKPAIKEGLHELKFTIDFEVKCNSIEMLIRKGSANFVLHLECSSTAFRIALTSEVPHIEYSLPKERVNGRIDLVAMLVMKLEENAYQSKERNEDYEGENIKLKRGNIIAYQNLPPVYVMKKTEELAQNDSFFSVIKQTSLDPNEIKPLTFNLRSDKIQILVDAKTYEAFVRYQNTREIGMAMLVLPALAYMITEAGDFPDSYSDYLWFQRLRKYYQKQGKDFIADVLQSDDNPITIAQEMLKNPISRAYRELCAFEV